MKYKQHPDEHRGKRTLHDLEGLTPRQQVIVRYPPDDSVLEELEIFYAMDPETTLDYLVHYTARTQDPISLFQHPEVNEIKTYSDYYKENS